jgi:hypothetical protein
MVVAVIIINNGYECIMAIMIITPRYNDITSTATRRDLMTKKSTTGECTRSLSRSICSSLKNMKQSKTRDGFGAETQESAQAPPSSCETGVKVKKPAREEERC